MAKQSTALAPKSNQPARQFSFPALLRNYATLANMAASIASSRKAGSLQTKEQVLAVMIQGAELGLGPMASVNAIYPIESKLTLSAHAMLALVARDLPGSKWTVKETPTSCELTLEIPGRGTFVGSYTLEDAERAGLVKDKSAWKRNPSDMLYARAASKACRRGAPDVLLGMYAPEELGLDIGDDDGPIIDVEVAPALPATPTEPAAPQTEPKAEQATYSTADNDPATAPTPATNGATKQPEPTRPAAADPEKPKPPTTTPTNGAANGSASTPAANGSKKVETSVLLELKRLKEGLTIGLAEWQSLLARFEVASAKDLLQSDALKLIGVLRKRKESEEVVEPAGTAAGSVGSSKN